MGESKKYTMNDLSIVEPSDIESMGGKRFLDGAEIKLLPREGFYATEYPISISKNGINIIAFLKVFPDSGRIYSLTYKKSNGTNGFIFEYVNIDDVKDTFQSVQNEINEQRNSKKGGRRTRRSKHSRKTRRVRKPKRKGARKSRKH